jgi:hypothetical protein
MEVWNGKYFTTLRKNLIEKTNHCSKYCLRANPCSVNNFLSHLITRGKTEYEINKFLENI